MRAAMLADLAVASLIDEVSLTPKPGLVDMGGRGAHRDLDWSLMCRSARCLRPAFLAMARAGERINDVTALRERIGRVGRDAEAIMLNETGGVNTHRGAIWALGLLVTAAAQDSADATAKAVAIRAGVLARRTDRYAPRYTGHKGERACRDYGVGGARGQARAGFPHVVGIALPQLRAARRIGSSEDDAQLDALLAIIAGLDDTCVLARGGREALVWLQRGAAHALMLGGAASKQGLAALLRLCRDAVSRNISPGGAADLLAATLFLDRTERHLAALRSHDGKHCL